MTKEPDPTRSSVCDSRPVALDGLPLTNRYQTPDRSRRMNDCFAIREQTFAVMLRNGRVGSECAIRFQGRESAIHWGQSQSPLADRNAAVGPSHVTLLQVILIRPISDPGEFLLWRHLDRVCNHRPPLVGPRVGYRERLNDSLAVGHHFVHSGLRHLWGRHQHLRDPFRTAGGPQGKIGIFKGSGEVTAMAEIYLGRSRCNENPEYMKEVLALLQAQKPSRQGLQLRRHPRAARLRRHRCAHALERLFPARAARSLRCAMPIVTMPS